MTVNELVERMEDFRGALPGAMLEVIAESATASKALIVNRITENGQDFQGQPFKPYSARYLKFKKGESTYLTNDGEVIPQLASNRYRGFVDYTLTGELWRDVGIIRQEENAQGLLVSVGANRQENKDKLQSLSDRAIGLALDTGDTSPLQSNVLSLSDTEEEIIDEFVDEELQKFVDQYFK